jgi:phosphoribosylaminoimidazole carboxylase PurE protein
MSIASAHRTPERVIKLVREAEKNGADVIIAGAGMAAHLAGIVAAHTLLPVIGVPLNSSPLDGLDSLLSTVQMPPGIPVATMAIGKAGARNAAIFALQIMASKDTSVREKLAQFRSDLKKEVEKKDKQLQKR